MWNLLVSRLRLHSPARIQPRSSRGPDTEFLYPVDRKGVPGRRRPAEGEIPNLPAVLREAFPGERVGPGACPEAWRKPDSFVDRSCGGRIVVCARSDGAANAREPV